MPPDSKFTDLKKQLEQHGWEHVRTKGSHHVFTGDGRPTISIPVHKGRVKDIYRKQIEKAVQELDE
jgi:predicted RNA binding protein YcfA (HicA-like mRNA interferase family)